MKIEEVEEEQQSVEDELAAQKRPLPHPFLKNSQSGKLG